MPDTQGDGSLAESYLFNGVSWDRARTPIVYKALVNVAITASTPVAIWTPTTGKKFRLMGIVVSCNTTAAKVKLLDAAVDTNLRIPAGLDTQPATVVDLKNGYLSVAANNVLNADVSASTTINGFVYGTEE
jgi:hypothetical protein